MIVPQQIQKVKRRKFKPITPKKSFKTKKKFKFKKSWIPFMIAGYVLIVLVGVGIKGGKGLGRFDQVSTDGVMSAEAPLFNPSNSIGEISENLLPFEYIMHTVREDETISLIAFQYSIDIETIISVNKIRNGAKLANKQLIIPEVNGFLCKVGRNDSVESLAEEFNIEPADILSVNRIATTNLSDYSRILIPAENRDTNIDEVLEDLWLYPVDGVLIRLYGETADPYSKVVSFHNGVDFRASLGQDVKATRAGEVFEVGFHNSFGKYLIIKHDGGYLSFYGHLDTINVSESDWVGQQDIIGTVGHSGYCSTNQLHFSLILNVDSVDPMELLL
jgi:murein DD-endopeptidase MepM/ murein hydrolase activator NlpD